MTPAVQIATILGLGIGAQWFAGRVRLPSILLLLSCGVLAGPVFGWIDADALFGGHDPLLQAVVSLSVIVILFEGGLTLQMTELRQVGRVVMNLVTIGVLLSWVLGSVAAHWLLDVDWAIASLLGAILTLSGPTVVAPLLRHLRPEGASSAILKWEGIVIDPVGALLAALVYQAVLIGDPLGSVGALGLAVGKAVVVGGFGAALGAMVLLLLFEKHWVADVMQAPLTLGTTLVVAVLCNELQHESGLITAVGMGLIFANQKTVPVQHISVFKEHLTMLLIPSLFVLLASRLRLEDLREHAWPGGVLFLLVLLFVVRPASVWLCTIGRGLRVQERLFLSWMFPRGIVAAAVAPFFALELSQRGLEGVEALVPVTYLVIIGTVATYGLTAGPVARRLGITRPSPQGLLIVGAGDLARAIGSTLSENGFQVLLTDTNRQNVAAARLAGLRARHANIVADEAFDDLDLGGIGRLLAMTPNDEVNTLAALQGREIFGRAKVFQLAPAAKGSPVNTEHAIDLRGRIAFAEDHTFARLSGMLRRGHAIKRTTLSKDFRFEDFRELYGEAAVPLFRITADGRLHVVQAQEGVVPEAGDTLISLADPRALEGNGDEGT